MIRFIARITASAARQIAIIRSVVDMFVILPTHYPVSTVPIIRSISTTWAFQFIVMPSAILAINNSLQRGK